MLSWPHQLLFGNEIKKTDMGRACSTYGERRGAYRDLVGKPERRRPLGRHRRRWEDDIKMDFLKVEWRRAWTG
jgi:hypothetical protein